MTESATILSCEMSCELLLYSSMGDLRWRVVTLPSKNMIKRLSHCLNTKNKVVSKLTSISNTQMKVINLKSVQNAALLFPLSCKQQQF